MTPPQGAKALPEAPERPTRYLIETWGCQMNEHDSEKMAGILGSQGLTPARREAEADLILLNTCAVREKASEKVFSRLGALRKRKLRRPEMIIGVCGCVAQMEQEIIFRRAPHVDFVMGPRNLSNLAQIVAGTRTRRHQLAVMDPRDRLLPEEPAAALRTSRARAFITVMEGCNKGCTFCIVPATRGKESCRTPESILQEAEQVTSGGIREIELLGQNVNAYRSGTWDFTRLLSAVARVPGLERLRFTTSHPLHFKNSIAELMGMQPVLCPHVHLPIQSGSDKVLKAMRRGYTREEFLSRIRRARECVEGIAFSTDIIVGFPGETDEDFRLTMSALEEVRFDQVYAFLYSPRRGTPAVELEDTVSREEKTARLHALQELQAGINTERNEAYVGTVQKILVEGPSVKNPDRLCGRTASNKLVNFAGPPEWTGGLIDVEIVAAGSTSLKGNPLNLASDGRSLDLAGSRGYN